MRQVELSPGCRVAFQTGGKRRSRGLPPLVLLHGFCEDRSLWAPLLPRLAHLPLLRIDLPGFGQSGLPLRPGMDACAEAVYAVLRHLGIDTCVLVGHSMGGYAALAFARQHPERLAGLGLVHSHPYADSPERAENRRRGIALLQSGKKNQYVGQLFPGLFAPAFAAAHPEVVQRLVRRGRRQPAEGIVAALEGMIARPDEQQTLRSASCPVLFLLGGQDSIIPPESVLPAAMQPAVCDLHLLPDVGHMGMFEAPAAVAHILSGFYRFCIR